MATPELLILLINVFVLACNLAVTALGLKCYTEFFKERVKVGPPRAGGGAP